MQAHRVQATVEPDGSVRVDALPFRPGDHVEVIVLPLPTERPDIERYPLRGSIYRYDRPTDPVAEDDWEALK